METCLSVDNEGFENIELNDLPSAHQQDDTVYCQNTFQKAKIFFSNKATTSV